MSLWKNICEWEEWPIGINKSELFEMLIETATKHAQIVLHKGKVEEAKRILIPASLQHLLL